MKEVVTIKLTKADLQTVHDLGLDYEVVKVEVPNFDYSDSLEWERQDAICKSEYRKLKQLEFEIRHEQIRKKR